MKSKEKKVGEPELGNVTKMNRGSQAALSGDIAAIVARAQARGVRVGVVDPGGVLATGDIKKAGGDPSKALCAKGATCVESIVGATKALASKKTGAKLVVVILTRDTFIPEALQEGRLEDVPLGWRQRAVSEFVKQARHAAGKSDSAVVFARVVNAESGWKEGLLETSGHYKEPVRIHEI